MKTVMTFILLFLSTQFVFAAVSNVRGGQADAPAGGESMAFFRGVTTDQDTGTVDEIIFKSGRIITGTILESIPGQGVKIRTQDGVVHSYKWSVVSKIKLGEHVADVPTGDDSPGSSQGKGSSGSRPRYVGSFRGSLLLGGTFNSAEIYFGLGLRCHYCIYPGLFVGIGFADHYVGTNVFGSGYVGAEFVYEMKRSNVSIQPYVSGGYLYFLGLSTVYIAPAMAVAIWVTPKIGVGADIKYAYAPSYSAGMGFIYLGVMLRL